MEDVDGRFNDADEVLDAGPHVWRGIRQRTPTAALALRRSSRPVWLIRSSVTRMLFRTDGIRLRLQREASGGKLL